MSNYVKYTTYQVVFKEFPDEITLAFNLSNCPNNCIGCHSPELKEDIGTELTDDEMLDVISKNKAVTCVGFMGGDANVKELIRLARVIRNKYPKLHIGWYSGKEVFPLYNGVFDYIKLGPYKQELGGLDSKTTNQRLYMKVAGDELSPTFIDITAKAFWESKPWEVDYFEQNEK